MPTIVLAAGSSQRSPEVYSSAAREFGRRVAREGWTLRTGGGSGRCLMGAAADGALGEGGKVEGVILKIWWRVRHRGIRRMKAVSTFALRKEALFKGAHAAVVFPGGYGTLDELGDLLTLRQTRLIDMPILFANIRDYFSPILAWDRRASKDRFLYGRRPFHVCSSVDAVIRRLRRELK